ncbi:MAG: hypothetical protein AAF004_00995 [Pseudomonadota bacterium]
MNKGALFGGVILIGYLAFEVYTINQARYQMEGPYIFGQFVSANYAYTTCRSPNELQSERFARNFTAIRARAVRELSQAHPDANDQDIHRMLEERAAQSTLTAGDIIRGKGCDDIEVWKLLRRFDNYTELNIG